jgi:hypothetical protein
MEYFQVRKNSREVIRILRGPFRGHDITRLQIWYRGPGSFEYLPGKVVAFNSEMIPGIMEGLREMAALDPVVDTSLMENSKGLADTLLQVLKAHRQPLHWEALSEIIRQHYPKVRVSKWMVYNTLLASPDLFKQVEEDVFSV